MLGHVLSEALKSGKGESAVDLTPEEYREKFASLLKLISVPVNEEIDRELAEERHAMVVKGLSATLVDAKAVELAVLKRKEDAIALCATLINAHGVADDFRELFKVLNPLFTSFPKARIAKITRELIDSARSAPELQIQLCEETIEWCRQEDRSFLRHRLQTKLASLYCEIGRYPAGLALIPTLQSEVKKLDDKLLLVEINLIDAKLNYAIRNIPHAKGSLTASKANANAINCPQYLQGQMDLVAGMLHAEEKDFKTAYSYFFEAYEAFGNLQDTELTATALKYMILSRILMGSAASVDMNNTKPAIMQRQDVVGLVEIAGAWQERSLEKFEHTLKKYAQIIAQDDFLSRHINAASDQLLAQAILKVVEPYSEVEIAHIAKKTRLSLEVVEVKLSQMILDHMTDGILDQMRGVFILYDKKKSNTIYHDGAAILEDLKEIVQVFSAKIEELE